ncbi:MAG: type II secretion system F family protein [Candidatus Omnitrophica bacterium]|nr:type II secretion system F family protein [Candidatus Omnitrophota bacterium]
MLTLVILLVFACAGMCVYFVIPSAVVSVHKINQQRAKDFAREMDRAMVAVDIQVVQRLYIIGPFVCAALGGIFSPENSIRPIGAVIGFVVGLVLPRMYANTLLKKRRQQFDSQLVDALMIMSSSFRGGMSLVQSMESVVEEMPDPIRHEFGIVLGENKMGIALDETLNRLYKRMPSTSLQQMVSAILLARETGGNLPVIFSRIVGTIRERRKIEENLMVLTVQGKLQALVMSGLPVGFFVLVNSTNPKYFKVMTSTDMGRMLLAIAIGLWLIGTFLIIKISSFDDF